MSSSRNLAFDHYAEVSQQTRLAKYSLGVQAVQTKLMNDMGQSLHSIVSIMDDVRKQHADTLAMQHEMLQRDHLQSQLEEFIYQSEKLVAEGNDSSAEVPPSSRYYMLLGVIETIRQVGIGTPIIRGRDNKATFEKVVQQVEGHIERHQDHPEVKEALQWAEEEEKRLAVERKRLEAENLKHQEENRKRQKERQSMLMELQKQRNVLVNERELLKFSDWYKKQFSWVLDADYTQALKIVIQGAIWYFGGFIWIPVWFFVSKLKIESMQNVAVDQQIESLDNHIRELAGGTINDELNQDNLGRPDSTSVSEWRMERPS